MHSLDTVDWILLAFAALVAVGSLVRLMRGHHDSLLSQFRSQLAARRQKKKADAQENPPRKVA